MEVSSISSSSVQQDFRAAETQGPVSITEDPVSGQVVAFSLNTAEPTAAVTADIPDSVPTTQPAKVVATLRIKRRRSSSAPAAAATGPTRKRREAAIQVEAVNEPAVRAIEPVKVIAEREAGVEGVQVKGLLRRMEDANARMIFARQGGCIFRVVVDGVTVYSVDLDTLPDDEPFPFSTDNFTPQANSTVAYRLECPPGTTEFPELDIAGLTLVTGPAAPPPVSSISSAAPPASSVPPGSGYTVTATVTQVISGSTVVSIQTTVVRETATATVSFLCQACQNSANHCQTTATAYVVSSYISTVVSTYTVVTGGSTATSTTTAYVVGPSSSPYLSCLLIRGQTVQQTVTATPSGNTSANVKPTITRTHQVCPARRTTTVFATATQTM